MKNIIKNCGNCKLFNKEKESCGVAILYEGKQYHMPVSPSDSCNMEELGIEVNQVRWWVEDNEGKPTNGNGIVKIEYPENFFGNKI